MKFGCGVRLVAISIGVSVLCDNLVSSWDVCLGMPCPAVVVVLLRERRSGERKRTIYGRRSESDGSFRDSYVRVRDRREEWNEGVQGAGCIDALEKRSQEVDGREERVAALFGFRVRVTL
jgi:hypothetical protein